MKSWTSLFVGNLLRVEHIFLVGKKSWENPVVQQVIPSPKVRITGYPKSIQEVADEPAIFFLTNMFVHIGIPPICLFIEKRYHKNVLFQIQIRPVKKFGEHSKLKPFQEWERLIQQCRKCVAAPPEAASREPFAAPMDTAAARRLQCTITPHHLHLCISRYRSGSGSLVWLSHLCRLIQPFTSRSLPIAYTCSSVRLSLGLLNIDRSDPMMSTCTNKAVFHHIS